MDNENSASLPSFLSPMLSVRYMTILFTTEPKRPMITMGFFVQILFFLELLIALFKFSMHLQLLFPNSQNHCKISLNIIFLMVKCIRWSINSIFRGWGDFCPELSIVLLQSRPYAQLSWHFPSASIGNSFCFSSILESSFPALMCLPLSWFTCPFHKAHYPVTSWDRNHRK